MPNWTVKIVAAGGAILAFLLAIKGYGISKKSEGKKELKQEIESDDLESMQESKVRREDVARMSDDELNSELFRDKT